jgi:hypothetical protein
MTTRTTTTIIRVAGDQTDPTARFHVKVSGGYIECSRLAAVTVDKIRCIYEQMMMCCTVHHSSSMSWWRTTVVLLLLMMMHEQPHSVVAVISASPGVYLIIFGREFVK